MPSMGMTAFEGAGEYRPTSHSNLYTRSRVQNHVSYEALDSVRTPRSVLLYQQSPDAGSPAGNEKALQRASAQHSEAQEAIVPLVFSPKPAML